MRTIYLLLLICVVCNAEIEFNLKDTYVLTGDKIDIPCDFTSDMTENPIIQWLDKNRALLYSFKKHNTTNTYKGTNPDVMVEKKGHLTIKEAKVTHNTDMSVLTCKISYDDGTTAEASLDFMVVKLPTSPAIMKINEYTENNEGFEIFDRKTSVGFCRSDYTYPAPTIEFLRNGESINNPTDDVFDAFLDSTSTKLGPDGVTSYAERTLLKVLDKNDHQANFTCRVQTKYGDKVDTKDYIMPKFNVLYATDTVELKADKPFAYEGDTITLMCMANGFPEPVVKINGETMASITVEVSAAVDGETYSCTANNGGGDLTSNEYTLNVLSLKVPVITGETEVNLGETLTVTCAAEGEPAPTVAWYFNEAKAQDDGTLTIPKASFANGGTYTCKASNGHDYLEKSVEHIVKVRGLKLLGDKEELVDGKKDEEVDIECTVQSDTDTAFKWTGTEEIPLITMEGQTYTSSVRVGPLTPELSEKAIECTAENKDKRIVTKTFKLPYIDGPKPDGEEIDVTTTRVIVEASTAPIGIIIAILVIVLIVAIVLAVLYNKGIICKKQEKGDESAADIALEINKDDVEAGNGKTEEVGTAPEEEKLMINEDRMND